MIHVEEIIFGTLYRSRNSEKKSPGKVDCGRTMNAKKARATKMITVETLGGNEGPNSGLVGSNSIQHSSGFIRVCSETKFKDFKSFEVVG